MLIQGRCHYLKASKTYTSGGYLYIYYKTLFFVYTFEILKTFLKSCGIKPAPPPKDQRCMPSSWFSKCSIKCVRSNVYLQLTYLFLWILCAFFSTEGV